MMNNEQWRTVGRSHGYDAANYADNVSGEDLETLSADRTLPLGLTPEQEMWYRDGFSSGIEDYGNEQYEDAFPEGED